MTTEDKFRTSTLVESCRAKARSALRQKIAEQRAKADPKVVVVRLPGANTSYGWEIRRYGTFVLDRTNEPFATVADAQTAGERVLATLQVESPDTAKAEYRLRGR